MPPGMMNRIFLWMSLLLGAAAYGQDKNQGVVTYERVTKWSKLYARLTFLSQEEKDRIANTWKNDDEAKEKMKLVFSPDRSLYTYLSEQGESEDGQWAWRNSEFKVYRDFAAERALEIHEMLGRSYVLDDSLPQPKWKVLNQLKDIAGYVCMKAETFDPVKNQKVVAWFAGDLANPAGPERSFGLPGLIMELDINDGDVVITATGVVFKDVAKELAYPKLKGRKIKNADYDKLLSDHIRDSMKAYRNPYWAIRY